MARSSVPVNATETSFRVLETIQLLDGGGASEIAAELDMATSTVHDHLRTLEGLDLLIRDDEQYHIGPRFLDFGGFARNRMKIFDVARPEVQKLAMETGQHANLMIEDNGMGIFLYKTKGEDAVPLDTFEGMRTYLHATSLGKAILAELPRDRVEEIVDTHGLPGQSENTITDREELFATLEEIRERGYATDDEERVMGMRCVGVPLRDDQGEALGAISVSGPTNVLRGELFHEELPEMLRQTANIIELRLTYD